MTFLLNVKLIFGKAKTDSRSRNLDLQFSLQKNYMGSFKTMPSPILRKYWTDNRVILGISPLNNAVSGQIDDLL